MPRTLELDYLSNKQSILGYIHVLVDELLGRMPLLILINHSHLATPPQHHGPRHQPLRPISNKHPLTYPCLLQQQTQHIPPQIRTGLGFTQKVELRDILNISFVDCKSEYVFGFLPFQVFLFRVLRALFELFVVLDDFADELFGVCGGLFEGLDLLVFELLGGFLGEDLAVVGFNLWLFFGLGVDLERLAELELPVDDLEAGVVRVLQELVQVDRDLTPFELPVVADLY